jgi:hypothetical protein
MPGTASSRPIVFQASGGHSGKRASFMRMRAMMCPGPLRSISSTIVRLASSPMVGRFL